MSIASIALEFLGAGLIVVDGRGRRAGGNSAARELLGLDRSLGPEALALALRTYPRLARLLEAGEGRVELRLEGARAERRVEARVFGVGLLRRRRAILLMDVTENSVLLERLGALASKDPLTGVYNRRRFDELGERDIELARRTRTGVGVLMLDLDYFKRINDGHGHAAGDRMLREVCGACLESLRSTDVIGRYGGEEFAVFLPGSGPEESASVAERLRSRVARIAMPDEGGPVTVTVSVGVYSGVPAPGEDLALYLRRADEALYRAKAKGRNRVCYWEPLSGS